MGSGCTSPLRHQMTRENALVIAVFGSGRTVGASQRAFGPARWTYVVEQPLGQRTPVSLGDIQEMRRVAADLVSLVDALSILGVSPERCSS